MNFINENEVNNIAECKLLHYILNPYKHTKIWNNHYSPIIHGCMNKIKDRAKFKNVQILLDSGCIYTIVIEMLITKLTTRKYTVIKWHMQEGNITTNVKVKIYFNPPKLRANCHVDNSTKNRYYIILGRDILTKIGLNLKLSEHVIKTDDETFKGLVAPMVDMGTYQFKDLNIGKITPEESFMNTCTEEKN